MLFSSGVEVFKMWSGNFKTSQPQYLNYFNRPIAVKINIKFGWEKVVNKKIHQIICCTHTNCIIIVSVS